jgi:hypothetical protein
MLNQRRNVTRSCFYRARIGSKWFTSLCRKLIRVARPIPVIKYGTERRKLRRVRTCAKPASMLAGVKQQPNLPRRWPGKNPRKHRAASNAGVVLFYSRFFRRAGTVKREVLMRKLFRRLAGKVSAWRAGLNPEFHYPELQIEYHGAGTKRVAVDVCLKPMSSYEVRPFPLF